MSEQSVEAPATIADTVEAKDIEINELDKTITVGNDETGRVTGIPIPEPTPEEKAAEEAKDTRPEWLPEKYKTTEAFLEGHKNLEKKMGEMGQKLGAFQGAPEDAYVLPEIEGWEWDPNDQVLTSVLAKFREDGFSQEHAEHYLSLWVDQQHANSEELAKEREGLGTAADERIANIVNWAKNNLTGTKSELVESMLETPTVASVELFEEIKGFLATNSINPPSAEATRPKEMTLKDLQNEYFHALPKIKDDPALQLEWEQKFADFLSVGNR